jgi:hypothetical protein
VDVFTRLLGDQAPEDRAVHVVDESLLTDARRRGRVDDALRRRIGRQVEDLVARGAARVVCTCSTIGGPCEEVGRTLGVDVLRVDRPMATLAVTSGARIVIVAALESTLGPTRQLLEEAARVNGRAVTIVDAPCLEAWSYWEAGDSDRYLATLASHLEALDGSGDVIVLAQASMAPVQDLVQLDALVLSSPLTAVLDLVESSRPRPIN